MIKAIGFGLVAALALASSAQAQTVPGPRVSLAFDRPQAASCESAALQNAWDFTYGTCYRPAGVNLGDPYIQNVRVIFAGTATVSTLVPRAQVTVETTTARCGGTPPCLRISDLSAPVGQATASVRFVDGEGREGSASNAIPFTGAAPSVPAASTLRVVP